MKERTVNIVIILLCVISIVFIANSLEDPLQVVTNSLISYEIYELVLALMLFIVTMFLKSFVHKMIYQHYEDKDTDRTKDLIIVESYLLAQIIRYIPGKVVGITAQSIKLTGGLLSKIVWITNILQYAVTNYNALIIILFSVLAISYGQIFIFILGLLISYSIYLLLNNWQFLVGFLKYFKDKLPENKTWSLKKINSIWFLLQLEWCFFLVGISLLAPGVESLSDSLILGLLYSFSAIVASLAIIMPSGILIRESLFIWISNQFGFGADLLLFLGVMIRIFLTLSDILAYIIFRLYRFSYDSRKE